VPIRYDQVATPAEFAVAVPVTGLPSAFVTVFVTVAPAAGEFPYSTIDVTVTVWRTENVEPDTETLSLRAGAVVTVQFAEPVPT